MSKNAVPVLNLNDLFDLCIYLINAIEVNDFVHP